MTNTQEQPQQQEQQQDDDDSNIYRYLVVDSGPIIRLTTISNLWQKAASYYTVPAVLQEIRDSKARQHLEQLPFDIQTRQASPEGIQAVVEFSRLTGDYHSLSAVDVQVLGLLYDLEREAAGGDMSHVRKTPKRQLGQKIQMMMMSSSSNEAEQKQSDSNSHEKHQANGQQQQQQPDGEEAEQEYDIVDSSDDDEDNEQEKPTKHHSVVNTAESNNINKEKSPTCTSKPKTWANVLVNPQASSTSLPMGASTQPKTDTITPVKISEQVVTTTLFGKMNLSASSSALPSKAISDKELGGQFSDAEGDDIGNDDDDDDDEYEYDPDKDISDEECDIYIRDPDEVKPSDAAAAAAAATATNKALLLLQEDLKSEFPSLAAARLVPYQESDDDKSKQPKKNIVDGDDDNERKLKSLQPISKSGKLYNSFRNYRDLMKPKPVKKAPVVEEKREEEEYKKESVVNTANDGEENEKKNESRIIGGMTLAGQDIDVEDDGEGWITSTKDIKAMKAVGALNPTTNPNNLDRNSAGNERQGPPNSQRAACATTDFAMQNVILQMNLELLSVDGVKVRKLKSWVTRCGACFKVYTSTENQGPLIGKRLFCERCGSDMMQRVAASVDGKTGRLRLHLSKKYKHNLRGTKFSLPKPGTGNRFQGDLLLREDQLMMGAWNQKVKMRSGGKAKSAAQSMFGRDIASNVGCHAHSMDTDDIRVGFGRRNPNAVKGRERRGKKKKSSDKACGLRRY